MKLIQLWFNNENLPTKKERQKALMLTLPQFYKWGFSAPIYAGFATTEDQRYGVLEIKIVILGLGLIYNENWDV